jgi:hypothetical protein
LTFRLVGFSRWQHSRPLQIGPQSQGCQEPEKNDYPQFHGGYHFQKRSNLAAIEGQANNGKRIMYKDSLLGWFFYFHDQYNCLKFSGSLETISKIGFWFKVAAGPRFKPEEY